MRLRTKVAVIILVVWGLMIATMYFGVQRILVNSYINLDAKRAVSRMGQVENAIDRLATGVSQFDTDTAVWDNTYQFIADKNPAYIKTNIDVSVFEASDLDLMLYYDAAGNPVFTRAVNIDRTKEVPLPSGLSAYLTKGGKLLNQPDMASKIRGLISLPSDIYLVASHTILKTNYSGPSRGALIFARRFGSAALKRVSEMTHLDLKLYRMDAISSNHHLESIYRKLLTLDKPYATIGNANQNILGYLLLKDINNKPIAIIEAVMPREIYQAGLVTIRRFNLIFVSFGVLFVVMLVYSLRFIIIRRLEKLNDRIIAIHSQRNFSLKINEESHDELTSVEMEANKMLAVIRDYAANQKVLLNKVSHELDVTNQFSKKLQEAERLLADIINTMPSMLIIIDSNFNITHLNYLSEKLLGSTVAALKGQPIFLHYPYLEQYRERLQSCINDKVTVSVDRILYKIGDKVYYYNVTFYPLSSSDRDQGIAVRIDDISEYMQLKENIQKNDKLASLGVLMAGIAHEINNPVNFIKSTTKSISRDIFDIITVLSKYRTIDTLTNFDLAKSEIKQLKESLELDYTIDEINRLMNGISEGTERTAAIVSGLKDFARTNTEIMKKYSVEAAIESTLALLTNKLKDRIEVIRAYGDTPEIDCFPGKLNQVFMNLIANAIDSIPNKGKIIVKTEKLNDEIAIHIIDNGVGMTEEVKAKIFEPFFTTKDVGKGQGLGLAISFGVISDHNGRIEVFSQPNQGSEFIVYLPITKK